MQARALTLSLCLLAMPVLRSNAQQLTLPLWPHGTPEPPQTTKPEDDNGVPVSTLPADHHMLSLSNVTVPTLSLYVPQNANGAAVVVFPGGGYVHLAWTKEGTDTCDWLNSIGVTCVLVKYRVPEPHYPESPADLEDAQQAIRLTRQHAEAWHIDPKRVGVLGYSAGGNLAALLSLYPNDHHVDGTKAAADVPGVHGRLNGQTMLTDAVDAKPDFTILVYPAYLAIDPAQVTLNPIYTPSANTPPTFVTAAENDKTYGRNALVYYRALLEAGVPAELHYYPTGGHGFGVHPNGPPGDWTQLATRWMQLQGIIPDKIEAADASR